MKSKDVNFLTFLRLFKEYRAVTNHTPSFSRLLGNWYIVTDSRMAGLPYANTYVIGHYNPSVRIIDLVSYTTYVVCVNFIHKLKSIPNDRIV